MGNTSAKIKSFISLDAAPHFKLEGQFAHDTNDEDSCYFLREEKSVKARYRFENLHTQDALEFDFLIKLNSEITPYEVLKKGMFDALKRFLTMQYEEMENYTGDDPSAERFMVDTIGFCNHHTFLKILKSSWLSEHFTEEMEADIYENGELKYNIRGTDILSVSGEKLGEYYFGLWKKDQQDEREGKLFYDSSHYVHCCADSFLQFMEALLGIPGFYEKYNTERFQINEAVRRLKFLGVSDEEIRAFEENRLVPRVEVNRDGTVIRGHHDDLEKLTVEGMGWRFWYSSELGPLKGGLPYLQLSDKGEIPMDAWLYVEPLVSEGEIYRSEMQPGEMTQIMTAIVFSGAGDYEYGTIKIKLTEDGPLRTG